VARAVSFWLTAERDTGSAGRTACEKVASVNPPWRGHDSENEGLVCLVLGLIDDWRTTSILLLFASPAHFLQFLFLFLAQFLQLLHLIACTHGDW
jgi:hypothetical protein